MRHFLVCVICAFVVSALFAAGTAGAETPTPAAPSGEGAGSSDGDSLRLQGIERYKAGDFSAAGVFFVRAREAYAAAGNLDGEARMCFNLALVYESLNDPEAALQHLREARAIYAALKDQSSEGWIVVNLARIEEDLGRKAQALTLYGEALPLVRTGYGPVEIAHVLAELADLEYQAGQPADALAHAQEALANYRAAGEHVNVGTMADLIGAVYLYAGDQAAAAASFVEARAAFKRANERAREAGSARLEAEARANSGELAAALAAFEDARARYASLGDWDKMASVGAEMAGLYHSLGNPARARFYYHEAQRACEKGCTAAGQTALAVEICFFYSQLGDLDAAEQACSPFVTGTPAGASAVERAAALENLGDVRRFAFRFQPALDAYSLAYAAYSEDSARRPRIDIKRGWSYLGLDEPGLALEQARAAAALGEGIQDPGLRAVLLAGVGNLAVALGETDMAQRYGEAARTLFSQIGDIAGEASALQILGAAQEQAGAKEAALGLLRRAVELTEILRENARADDLRQGVTSMRAGLYRSAVRVAAELGRVEEAFELAERGRARTFLDRLGNQSLAEAAEPGSTAAALLREEVAQRERLALLASELAGLQVQPGQMYDAERVRRLQGELEAGREAYADLLTRIAVSDPAAGALLGAAPPALSALQQKLDGDTNLLAYYVLSDQVLAFVIRRDALELVRLPVTETRLAELVAAFRRFSLQDTMPPELTELSKALLEPLAGRLSTNRIGIIPHGVLHYVPFAALSLSDNGGPVLFGERRQLFSLPAAGSLAYLQHNSLEGKALVVGQGAAEGLPVLHYAEQEAHEVAEILGVEPLLGKQATESAVRAASLEASIIHIAGHGILSAREPLFSRIALARDDSNDGNLEVHEIYGLRLPKAGLVVLSACDTQPGLADAGDDVVGLNRAFLAAGASSVVATLWSVDETATAALMREFYRSLRMGLNKTEALAAAQASIRNDAAHPEWRHPYYWAAFVLSGDPGEAASGSLAGENGSFLAQLPSWVWWAIGVLVFLVATVGLLHGKRKGRVSVWGRM